jgi:hypothetical protein
MQQASLEIEDVTCELNGSKKLAHPCLIKAINVLISVATCMAKCRLTTLSGEAIFSRLVRLMSRVRVKFVSETIQSHSISIDYFAESSLWV